MKNLICACRNLFAASLALAVSTHVYGVEEREGRALAVDSDRIEETVSTLSIKDAREELWKEELDRRLVEAKKGEGKGPSEGVNQRIDAKLSGRVGLSDSLNLLGCALWADNNSLRSIAFEGAGVAVFEAPSRLPPGKSKDLAEQKGKRTGEGFETGEDARPRSYYVAFSIKPSVSADAGKLTHIIVGGATIAFGATESTDGKRNGKLYLLNGDYRNSTMADWVHVGRFFGLKPDLTFPHPIGLVLRIDEESREWDLYFNGRLEYAGLRLGRGSRSIIVDSGGAALTVLNGVEFFDENPLFEDADDDGIDDLIEAELGFDVGRHDRLALDELGEFSNLQYFANARKKYALPDAQRVKIEREKSDRRGDKNDKDDSKKSRKGGNL